MDAESIKLISSMAVGIGGPLFFIVKMAIKAIQKIYTDMANANSKIQHEMQKSHEKQLEEAWKDKKKLMEYLDEKTKSDIAVSVTLTQIAGQMECINERLKDVEMITVKEE